MARIALQWNALLRFDGEVRTPLLRDEFRARNMILKVRDMLNPLVSDCVILTNGSFYMLTKSTMD